MSSPAGPRGLRDAAWPWPSQTKLEQIEKRRAYEPDSTSPIQSSGPVRGLRGVRDFDQLFGWPSFHDQQCEKLNRWVHEPLSRSQGPSHRRNDEMRSWFKTWGAVPLSLAMRLIPSSVALTLSVL